MEEIRIDYREDRDIPLASILELYRASEWSSAEKPDALHAGLQNSHSLITAWHGDRLVGLGNAISDGFLVVYYPHLIVAAEYRKRGIGKAIMRNMIERYADFHQQILVADGEATGFYEKCGFETAGGTKSMWIYDGNDHD